MSEELQSRATVEILGEEFLTRRRAGEAVTVDQYVEANPEQGKQIRRLFHAMLAMERFKLCALASGSTLGLESPQLGPRKRLGDFRIVREIGRGGMGVVYEAEQESLRRRVALKVISRQTLDRYRHLQPFHAEPQTAGRLHHTNIVPVFGVGEQDGWQFFVMQKIEGVSLDRFIDVEASEQLPVPENQSLWQWMAGVGIQVADAIAYAHSQGVLHRDIKPSNLLLDGKGTIWVTDFGLAMPLPDAQAESQGKVAGTLRYMAPEHLSGFQGVSCDIYSLGLTLYELSTGRPAFEAHSRVEYVDKITRGDITPLRRVRRDIPRDLDAIISKAISRDAADRYRSVADMSADLRRYAAGHPVAARPLSRAGRAGRWAGRNPAVASLSAVLLLGAAVSFAVIAIKWREAVLANRRAETNLAVALESMDQILTRFASGWMARPVSAADDDFDDASPLQYQIAVSDYNAAVLQDALKFYDRFVEQNETNVRLQRDIAKVHRRVGDIYERLGQYATAEEAYHRSLAILNAQPVDEDCMLAVQRANTMNQLALTMHATSRFEEAERWFQRAKATVAYPGFSDEPDCQAELAQTCNYLGQTLWMMHRHRAAKQNHQQAVELLERLVARYPRRTDYRLALAHAYRFYSFYIEREDRSDSASIRLAGIEILEQLVGDFPQVPDYRCELSEMLVSTSHARSSEPSSSTRLARLERAESIARRLVAQHPSIPRYRAVLARCLRELAHSHRHTDRRRAEPCYRESVAIYRMLASEFNGIPVYQLLFAMVLKDHAANLRELGRVEEAREALEEAVRAQKAFVRLRPDSRHGRGMLWHLNAELYRTMTLLEADPAESPNVDEST